MSYPTRRFITEAERQTIFDRWFKGESQHSIARSLERGHTSIQGVLSRTGGIRPFLRQEARSSFSQPQTKVRSMLSIKRTRW